MPSALASLENSCATVCSEEASPDDPQAASIAAIGSTIAKITVFRIACTTPLFHS